MMIIIVVHNYHKLIQDHYMKTEVDEKKVAKIEAKANKTIEVIDSFEIKNDKQMDQASELLSKANTELKACVADKEIYTKPLNAVISSIRKRYKPTEKKLEAGIKILRKAISEYQTKKEAEAEAKEAKVLDRVGSGRGKLGIDAAAKQIAEIDGPAKKVSTASGAVSFKDDYEIIHVDLRVLPVQFLNCDNVAIRKVFKAGGTVEGVQVKKIKVPINRTA